jgi:hypothetical protein
MLTRLDRFGTALAVLIVALAAVGCRPGRPGLERGVVLEGAPSVEAILADLAENDARIQSLRERQALMTLVSPKLKATQVVSADIAFERPDKLYIEGRQRAFRTVAFRIRSDSSGYVVQVPTDDAVYVGREGERIEGVPFSVSPSDIARELFLPEEWSELEPRRVELASYDPATQTAVLLIGPRRNPTRRVVVEGPPWRVVESERLGEGGTVYARTVRSGYRDWEGIRFPEAIVATFPAQETEVRIQKIDNPKFNIPLEDRLFAIDWNQYAGSAD